MKQKYIEGTNEQYSIREDGVIISNYKRGANNINHYRQVELKYFLLKDLVTVNIIIQGKRRPLTVKNLMVKHFIKPCHQKDLSKWIVTHIDGDVYNLGIDNLKYEHRQICNNPIRRAFMSENHIKNNATKAHKIHVKNLSRSIVAGKLNIPVKDLTDYIYDSYVTNLLFKRELSKRHKLSIHSIK